MSPKRISIFIIAILLSFTLIFPGSPMIRSQVGTAAEHTGAWVDTVTIRVIDSGSALSDIKAGNIDLYASGLGASDYLTAKSDPEIETVLTSGLYYELTLNPAGPEFDDGRLNPFSSPSIREALNWLIDRDYIVEQILNTAGKPKYFPIMVGYPDYNLYSSKVAELEAKYAYNFTLAQSTINTEMLGLGASLVNGKWNYGGQAVTLIFLIRSDSDRLRIPIGDYAADQLEAIGFTVERQYVRSSEASPLWLGSDPAEGLWHIYTGAWSNPVIDRDEGDNFEFFYSPNSAYGYSSLWQAYNPIPEFADLMDKLAYNKFTTSIERDTLFPRVLELALEDSVHIWLADGKNYLPRSASVTAAFDIAQGMSHLWPYTARFLDQGGGHLRIGEPDILVDPWNPVAGSNWAFDQDAIRATEDDALLSNPQDGLLMAQRVQSAVVTAQEGLPLRKSFNWVTLDYATVINVPADAWVDWDAVNQRFVTAGEKYPTGSTALIKSVVTYPDDLFTTITWHDGSPLDVADFVMGMILLYDRAKPESAIYDESVDYLADYLPNAYKGIRIVSTQPLVIETYLNFYQLDAELNVSTWWPKGDYGPLPWHTTALAAKAEAEGLLAFSSTKADTLGIAWTNYVTGPSLTTLAGQLTQVTAQNYIPYPNTLSAYISQPEATARWSNLTSWYTNKGHFWLGSGPFYLESADPVQKVVTFNRFEAFPDLSTKWDEYVDLPAPVLVIDNGSGQPGSTFTVTGTYYPPNSLATISVNWINLGTFMTDEVGSFSLTLTTPESAEPGMYLVSVSVNPSATLFFELDLESPLLVTDLLPIHFDSTATMPVELLFLPNIEHR